MFTATAFRSIQLVPRISIVKDFATTTIDWKCPFVLETGGLLEEDVESLCDDLMQEISDTIITLQQKKKKKNGASQKDEAEEEIDVQFYDCTVAQAVELLLQSQPDNALFAFCEGILSSTTRKDYSGKEALSSLWLHKDDEDDTNNAIDWFDYFPPPTRPSDCVVLAGAGASSTLHKDPFEWTGTSFCLEGTKVWRFLEPPTPTTSTGSSNSSDSWDDLLQMYRLDSVAWNSNPDDNDHDDYDNNTDGLVLSRGWQSDHSLFTTTTSSSSMRTIPSARDFSEMEDDNDRFQLLEDIALDWNCLPPSLPLLDNNVDCWTTVQRPGDLLWIPPDWWHQTYALEPSVAVASQRCHSTIDASRVLRHIVRTATGTIDEGAPDVLLQDSYSSCSQDPKEIQRIVDTLFAYLKEQQQRQQKQ